LRFFEKELIHTNAQMGSGDVNTHCVLQEDTIKLLKEAMKRLGLSARAYNRILKVARTIADMEGSETIQTEHVSEAIQYRTLDRLNWTIT
jgi:magnesium chelatase family protein